MGIQKICVGVILSFLKGGGKLPPPKEITINKNARGFIENKQAAQETLELTGNLAILPFLCYTHYSE